MGKSLRKAIYNFTESFRFDNPPHNKRILFTSHQMIICLKAFIKLIEPLEAYFIAKESKMPTADERATRLYGIGWYDACELILVYLKATLKDDRSDELIAYIIISKAVPKLNSLIKVIDPENTCRGGDSLKRLYSVHNSLAYLSKSEE